MTLTQVKPSEEAFNREPQLQLRGSQIKNAAGPARIKYLRIALQLVGVAFIFGICLAVRLVLAHGQPHSALSPDDSGCLCHAGGLSVVC
jgi:hypothetical protein